MNLTPPPPSQKSCSQMALWYYFFLHRLGTQPTRFMTYAYLIFWCAEEFRPTELIDYVVPVHLTWKMSSLRTLWNAELTHLIDVALLRTSEWTDKFNEKITVQEGPQDHYQVQRDHTVEDKRTQHKFALKNWMFLKMHVIFASQLKFQISNNATSHGLTKSVHLLFVSSTIDRVRPTIHDAVLEFSTIWVLSVWRFFTEDQQNEDNGDDDV